MVRLVNWTRVLALCAALGAPAVVLAEGNPAPAAGGADLQGLLTQIHRANQEEVALGKLAIVRAQSDDVADFGKTMVNDHTKADVSALELARQKKVKLTPEFAMADKAEKPAGGTPAVGAAPSGHRQTLEKLAKLSGPEFDREYMSTMVSMHSETLRSLQADQQKVTDDDAKSYVKDLVSTVEKHQKQAQDLAQKLASEGAKTPAPATKAPETK